MDAQITNEQIHQIMDEWNSEEDVDFNFEILEFLTQFGDSKLFNYLVKKTIPLIETEEDFQDLLTTCVHYFHFLDKESQELKVEQILKNRSSKSLELPVDKNDPHLNELLKTLEI